MKCLPTMPDLMGKVQAQWEPINFLLLRFLVRILRKRTTCFSTPLPEKLRDQFKVVVAHRQLAPDYWRLVRPDQLVQGHHIAMVAP